jgi:N-acetylneuraminic acid mutarotase
MTILISVTFFTLLYLACTIEPNEKAKLAWEVALAVGDIPGARGSAAMTAIRDKLVLFGGYLECFDENAGCDHFFYSDTLIFDTKKETWRLQNPPVSPPPRVLSGIDTIPSTHSAILFGGIQFNVDVSVFLPYNDMWKYNLNTNEWTQIVYNNQPPTPRGGIKAFILDNNLYTWGGFDNTFNVVNDVWKFDLETLLWTQLLANTALPTSPQARYIYNANLHPQQKRIYIFGGSRPIGGGEFEHFNDTWYYDIDENQFVQIITPSRTSVQGRTHAISALVEDTWLIALGDNPDTLGECQTDEASRGQNPIDEIITLEVSLHEIADGSNWKQRKRDFTPKPTKRPAYAVVKDSELWSFGGFGFVCPENISTPLWNRETYYLPLDLNENFN